MAIEIKSALFLLVATTLSVTWSIPMNSTIQHTGNCKPDFCQTAKFKCISTDSCNGTVVQPTEPCQCCPVCMNYREEGEPCEIEKEEPLKIISDPTHSFTTFIASNGTEGNEKENSASLQENNDNSDKNTKQCKPGLTCLLGTCVTVF